MNAEAPLLEWAADVVGCQTFDSVAALAGGSTSTVLRLDTQTERGPLTVIAKQLGADIAGDDLKLIAREARVLEALRPLDLPVPELLACDADGICAGRPAMLMSALPGALLDGPDALRRSIPACVDALVDLHQRARALLAGRRFSPWFDPARLRARPASAAPELWARAARIQARFPEPATNGFIHRDPHPANMLFADGRVSGLLDWPHAGRGPRGFDLSRVALNLACLLDVEATRELRERWEAATGTRHDPLLDVYALLESEPVTDGGHRTWEALGVRVDQDTGNERQEAFLADALDRMTVRRLK